MTIFKIDSIFPTCSNLIRAVCAGTKEAIQEFKDEIKQHFAIKEEDEMKEYAGCKVKRTGEKSLIMYQDDLINKIDRIFGEEANKLQIYGMPTGTGEHIKRSEEDEILFEKAEQSLFGSGVGLLQNMMYVIIICKLIFGVADANFFQPIIALPKYHCLIELLLIN